MLTVAALATAQAQLALSMERSEHLKLQRLLDLEPNSFIPAHGDIIENPQERLRFYIEHRLAREERVRCALSDEASPLSAITRDSYPELDTQLLPLAERSCLAHLIRLEELGEALRCGELWSAL